VTRPHPSSPTLVFSRGDAAIASSVGAYWVLSQLALFSPHLLLYPQNRVLCRLRDTEFQHSFGGNLDLLLRLGIYPDVCLPLLLYELAKSRHDEFATLLISLVSERAERL
jgi:hypothetical protein